MANRFGDLASIARRGGEVPASGDGEVKTNAWLVHEAVLTEIRSGTDTPPIVEHEGLQGYEWHGHQNGVIHRLFGDKVSGDPDNTESVSFKRELNRYLRNTNNMVCLRSSRDAKTPSVWWVRKDFSEEAPQVRTKPRRTTALDARQPRAAGSEVVLAFKCTWPECEERRETKARIVAHHFKEHRSAEIYIIETLGKLGVPARVATVHRTAEASGYPGGVETTRSTLEAMLEKKQVIRREVATPGGTGWAYVLSTVTDPDWDAAATPAAPPEPEPKPASKPAKPKRDGTYLCREEGCQNPGPFDSADQRRSHERATHPLSTSSKYECTWPGCLDDPFHSMHAVGIHVSRKHGQHRTTAAYRAIMQEIKNNAEGKPSRSPTPVTTLPSPPEPVVVSPGLATPTGPRVPAPPTPPPAPTSPAEPVPLPRQVMNPFPPPGAPVTESPASPPTSGTHPVVVKVSPTGDLTAGALREIVEENLTLRKENAELLQRLADRAHRDEVVSQLVKNLHQLDEE